MINTATLGNAATAVIGAAFCTVAAMAITVPSAHAAAPAGFQKSVEASIDRNLRLPVADNSGVATVAITVDGNGEVLAADVVKSSGQSRYDREALRTARAVDYPATGKTRTVAMVLGFNQPATKAAIVQGKQLVDAYRTDRRQMLADKTTDQPVG
jgi:TonB family protein